MYSTQYRQSLQSPNVSPPVIQDQGPFSIVNRPIPVYTLSAHVQPQPEPEPLYQPRPVRTQATFGVWVSTRRKHWHNWLKRK